MTENGESPKPCPPGRIRKDGKCVMPEVTFTTLLISLNNSALYHLGELASPETGEKARDMVLAKHTIDTLRLLQDKTKGNLNGQEGELLENILYDLRMRYLQAVG